MNFVSKTSIPDDFATAIKEEILNIIIQTRKSSLNDQFPPYLSKAEAAKYLGISTQTLTEWMLNPNLHLPYKRIGKTYRFNRLELDRFMTNESRGDH
ncbi:helix-turn-helix domain-containing protein [Limosilactobacillus vaginalis]|uniref:helix-turn-helix domain-containing protein n=1 Tax=Limosilactobacillus vaginalis TaxID=1633 RepID=UPI0025A3D1A8|nr:helix-turn-helix domain-containing protein [Limosilactobacillus vaginalis]MDM8220988.1 helix-turn-helix domain-containing protein [Limosilactobacillus vaginalis]MDM8303732.1 helix-turn-helix domain-containing protein [Limosilactobacillus vaginalis]